MNTTNDGQFQKYAVESGAYIREHFFGPDPRLRKMVDAPLRRRAAPAAPRRPRLPQALLRLQAGGGAEGDRPPSSSPTPSRAGPSARDSRGATRPTRSRSSPRTSCAAFRDRIQLPITDKQLSGGLPPYYHPGPKSARGRVPDEPAAGPGRAGAPAQHPRPAAGAARGGAPTPRRSRGREAGPRRPPPPSPPSSATCCATRASAAGSCPSSPTRRAPSAWTRSSARSRSTPPTGQQYEPVDAEMVLQLQRGPGRPAARGGHHRGGLDGLLHRRRHRLLDLRRADDPLLHLLLDVRLPAGRGPDLGLRRLARTRLHAGRDGGTHHPERRGAAAPGRPLAAPLLGPPPRAHLRPRLRLRAGGRSSATASSGCAWTTRTPSTTSPSTTRTTPSRPSPRAWTRPSCAASTSAALGRRPHAPGHHPGQRHRPWQAALQRPAATSPRTTTSPPTSGASPATSSCATTPSRWSGGTGCTPSRSRASRYIAEQLRDRPGPIVAVTDYVKAVSDQVARFVRQDFIPLGTDGFGRSDTRAGAAPPLRDRRRARHGGGAGRVGPGRGDPPPRGGRRAGAVRDRHRAARPAGAVGDWRREAG